MNATPLRQRSLSAEFAGALADRLVLLANHVLRAEPAATARLRPHAGRVLEVRVVRWPGILPPLPTLFVAVTPAGLLERLDADATPAASLRIAVDAADPAALVAGALRGRRPRVDLEGDAALAGDVHWLIDNLRWDVLDDVQRFAGPGPAAVAERLGRPLADLAGGLLRAIDRVRAGTARGDG